MALGYTASDKMDDGKVNHSLVKNPYNYFTIKNEELKAEARYGDYDYGPFGEEFDGKGKMKGDVPDSIPPGATIGEIEAALGLVDQSLGQRDYEQRTGSINPWEVKRHEDRINREKKYRSKLEEKLQD